MAQQPHGGEETDEQAAVPRQPETPEEWRQRLQRELRARAAAEPGKPTTRAEVDEFFRCINAILEPLFVKVSAALGLPPKEFVPIRTPWTPPEEPAPTSNAVPLRRNVRKRRRRALGKTEITLGD